MPQPLAAATYAGPPEWTLGRVFTSWQFEPAVVAVAVLAAAAYLYGVARARRRGAGAWAPGKTAAFLGGLALWVFTTCSGLGVYERVLFTDRAVQAVTLLMIVPLLLAMGGPVGLLVAACGPGSRGERWITGALRSPVSQFLMFPLVSTVVLMLPPWLFYFTGWYAAALRGGAADTLFHLGFVLLGMVYFWPRLQIDPVAKHYHPLFSILVTVGEVIADAALGFVMVFGSHHFAHLYRPWGMDPVDDVKWGGATLWGLGDIAGLPFLAALIVRVVREERTRTAEVDRQLDEAEAAEAAETARAAAAAVALGEPEPEPPAQQGLARPWWETDPRFAHRYGRPSS
ncbi:cytochrome c oxidase assembly protein [Phaeacidiphilus oryzae]|uniref:cytochrome c oxidase assembly protein n=1 Tax=Phaeacidiphilus oryzae TaxID=348818 RepID=UPI00068B4B36|nr:cytochrome c oxidase assembly protein [Phaeacidiphilus oryzae]